MTGAYFNIYYRYMLPAYFTLISIPLGLVGSILYIRDMYRGTVRPNRVSFFLWSLAPLIGSAIALSEGQSFLVIPIIMAGFNPLLVLCFSFARRVGYWKLEHFDYFCGLISLVALMLWIFAGAPLLAFVFAILADLFASIPTIRKAWRSPESESPFLYIISSLGNIVALLTIVTWDITSYGFPIYLTLANMAILAGVYRAKVFAKK